MVLHLVTQLWELLHDNDIEGDNEEEEQEEEVDEYGDIIDFDAPYMIKKFFKG